MPQTVEVRFKGTRRDFFHWPDGQDPLRLNEAVIVQAERGQDFGRVQSAGAVAEKKCGGGCTSCERGSAEKTPLVAADEPPDSNPVAESPSRPAAEPSDPEPPPPEPSASRRPILRRASPEEIRAANELRRQEEEARRQVAEKVRHHKLDMKVSDTEWQWDRAKLTIFFTAEKRVDFRALVRDLAGMFRARIELRQIGVRDEAARLGGVGRCGREYCCSTWLGELTPVSLALAKDQHLSLNPTQISGGCGRLLCCLKYEHEFYVAARKRFPREGKAIATARGREKVIAVDIFRERVFLRHDEQGSRIIPLVQLREEMEHAPPLETLASSAPTSGPPTRRAAEPPGRRPAMPPSRPAGPPPSRRAAPPPSRPAAEPPSPPATDPPATAGAGDAARKSRRRRRGRRGGRGGAQGGGPPAPPSTPEG
ncbi:MAG: regulatory iron-sulfur-containing complex subunit RicT [Gemmatimonadota bacterium]|nr:regulatory iron-sulfur-containing complex subunit RicT [Gemmatimonadota bacterium]